MTSKTATDLINEVASLLGISEAGEALGNVESTIIDGSIDPVLEEVEHIVYIGDRDDIPGRYFQTLARLVAVHAAAKFANGTPDMATIRVHENRLRELAAGQPSYQTLKVDYF